ncbi:Guanylyl cyclase [Fimicolochytrium jonesii]|uniref:Guanylyl cyclase n=1 Tax=Fimicolochytrium jonesii TaxID=1396493 RepID=UPI0022FE8F57|nr:Guanylyl cyclase [Fimicolochytrium jonesii]KAI8816178.1 Guanylyl cyclase [Fimicolochytrium jonesii]
MAGSYPCSSHSPSRIQVATWDCGLACVSMVLTALSIAHTHADLLDADDGAAADADGLWTIDLAYLLRKFGVRDFTYYTSYIGVNQRYTHSLFYARTLPSDRRRIHALFQRAAENRVRVVAHTLPVLDIVRFVDSGLYACVVLVDLRRLRCRWCSGWTKRFWRGLWDFIGHYILLVAYDESTDSFLYRDPGTHEELCAVSVDGFEAARKAVGTDCDVVVVRVVEG